MLYNSSQFNYQAYTFFSNVFVIPIFRPISQQYYIKNLSTSTSINFVALGKHYQMSSFGEKKAIKFAHEIPLTFLQYNYRQLSRTYPAGVRIDSSNYDPLPLWAVGCQMGANAVGLQRFNI